MPLLNLDDPNDRILGEVLRRNAELRPDATYLMSGDRRWNYGQVNDLANAYAAGLARLGVERGDTVALVNIRSARCHNPCRA